MIDWYDAATEREDVFSLPRIAPQGQDGTAHFNFFDNERQLSFQWDGRHVQHVVVSHGGYGEPIKWTFSFLEFWRKSATGYIKAQEPVFNRGDEMFAAAYHFQRACENWINWMEETADEGSDAAPEDDRLFRVLFVQTNPNWSNVPEANRLFIKGVGNHLNNMLNARGHLFLNEAFDSLGLPRTSDGARYGWATPSKGVSLHSQDSGQGPILLTFDVDGEIWDRIE